MANIDFAEWALLLSDAETIHETADEHARRLRHLERDIRTADLTDVEEHGLLARIARMA